MDDLDDWIASRSVCKKAMLAIAAKTGLRGSLNAAKRAVPTLDCT